MTLTPQDIAEARRVIEPGKAVMIDGNTTAWLVDRLSLALSEVEHLTAEVEKLRDERDEVASLLGQMHGGIDEHENCYECAALALLRRRDG
jgi:hypothetical protein